MHGIWLQYAKVIRGSVLLLKGRGIKDSFSKHAYYSILEQHPTMSISCSVADHDPSQSSWVKILMNHFYGKLM